VAVADCSSGAAAAMTHQTQQQQQQAEMLPRIGGEAAAVLGQLACLKLESCRLRTRQLQVRAHCCCCCTSLYTCTDCIDSCCACAVGCAFVTSPGKACSLRYWAD
jgi:hypothetical protein